MPKVYQTLCEIPTLTRIFKTSLSNTYIGARLTFGRCTPLNMSKTLLDVVLTNDFRGGMCAVGVTGDHDVHASERLVAGNAGNVIIGA